ncbi:hypothetical protein KJ652_03245 [Patescibacteria group bacterium]|nr:hypothetical protein [Patescibacteria group bacterium]MBU1123583.1 hypothetical protein [Patescibacteria group bacterium]MBU1911778.1 hypothetical protein [Patescibacteria group bacterium]
MTTILQSIKNLNGTILPEPPSTDEEFLSEEFSADGPTAPPPDDLKAKVIKIDKNTNQKLIIVTHDKTLLCLKRNIARLGKKEWVAPLSTVTTIILALITADFRSALWLGPAEWKAMFVLSGFLATGWLAFSLRRSMHALTVNEATYNIVQQMGGKANVSN